MGRGLKNPRGHEKIVGALAPELPTFSLWWHYRQAPQQNETE